MAARKRRRPGRRGTAGGGAWVVAGLALAGVWWLLAQIGVSAGLADVGDATGDTAGDPAGGSVVSGRPVADIPARYLALYRRAGGVCRGLDWALLAGVGKVESDHGRLRAPGVRSGTNFAGAAGPMQFLRPTWAQVRRAHPGLGPDLYDPDNAVPGAAHYLCDSGLSDGGSVRRALWAYNQSTSYANDVLDHAARYRAAGASAAGGGR